MKRNKKILIATVCFFRSFLFFYLLKPWNYNSRLLRRNGEGAVGLVSKATVWHPLHPHYRDDVIVGDDGGEEGRGGEGDGCRRARDVGDCQRWRRESSCLTTQENTLKLKRS